MKTGFTYSLIVLLFLLSGCSPAQENWQGKKVPSGFYPPQENYISAAKKAGAVDLTTYLPKNFVKNASIDYTVYLQKGIDKNDVVVFPDFPILVNDNGLKLKSNSKVFFNRKSELILKSSSRSSYSILSLKNVSNISVYNPVITGDRTTHLSNTGQWGMGIWLENADDVQIIAPKISNCWGDGIYIGNTTDTYSENVIIKDGIIENNRRNGISITSGKNIVVKNSLIANSNGQNPQSGIDIEPNSSKDIIENITLRDITTYNNQMHGIIISIGNIVAGNVSKKISVSISGHKDYHSTLALGLFLNREDQSNYKLLSGVIEIAGVNYNDNRIFVRNYTTRPTAVQINMDGFSFKRNKKKVLVKNDDLKIFLNASNLKKNTIR